MVEPTVPAHTEMAAPIAPGPPIATAASIPTDRVPDTAAAGLLLPAAVRPIAAAVRPIIPALDTEAQAPAPAPPIAPAVLLPPAATALPAAPTAVGLVPVAPTAVDAQADSAAQADRVAEGEDNPSKTPHAPNLDFLYHLFFIRT